MNRSRYIPKKTVYIVLAIQTVVFFTVFNDFNTTRTLVALAVAAVVSPLPMLTYEHNRRHA